MSLRNSSYNMVAALSICTLKEQRRDICFLWSEGVKPSEICRRMKVQYGDSCLSQGRVYGWKDFKTEDKTLVMNTGVGDQLAWQLKQQIQQ
jgi:hypothetical protein